GIGYWVLGIGYWVLGIGYWGTALCAYGDRYSTAPSMREKISWTASDMRSFTSFLMVIVYDKCHECVKQPLAHLI
ncbi:MAG: hypothetical protein LBV68_04865, partial [Spirochaetaceae bacterium]|nr:hypothetical protein [Spirochaetaceae bacterium]